MISLWVVVYYSFYQMKINYTDHALERMRQRGISPWEIEEVFARGVKVDAADGLRMATLKLENQGITLVVIYSIKNPKNIEIITTYRQ
jgi:uncharacterized DUF497 family protein